MSLFSIVDHTTSYPVLSSLVSNTRPTCTGRGAVCGVLPWVLLMPCLSGCVRLYMEHLDEVGLACLVDYNEKHTHHTS